MTGKKKQAELHQLKIENRILRAALENTSRKIVTLENLIPDPAKEYKREIDTLKAYHSVKVKLLLSQMQSSRDERAEKSEFKEVASAYWKHVHQTSEDPHACWRPEIDYVVGFLTWFFGEQGNLINAGDEVRHQGDLDSILKDVRIAASERTVAGLSMMSDRLIESLSLKCLEEERMVSEIFELKKALSLTQDPDWYWKEKPTAERPFGTLKSWGEIRAELAAVVLGAGKPAPLKYSKK